MSSEAKISGKYKLQEHSGEYISQYPHPLLGSWGAETVVNPMLVSKKYNINYKIITNKVTLM